MRDLEELIPQVETTMQEKAELEQQLASEERARSALEEQDALRRELQDALRRTTSMHEQLQADTHTLQAENARLARQHQVRRSRRLQEHLGGRHPCLASKQRYVRTLLTRQHCPPARLLHAGRLRSQLHTYALCSGRHCLSRQAC